VAVRLTTGGCLFTGYSRLSIRL